MRIRTARTNEGGPRKADRVQVQPSCNERWSITYDRLEIHQDSLYNTLITSGERLRRRQPTLRRARWKNDVPRPEETNMRCSWQDVPDITVSLAYTCGCGAPDCPYTAIPWERLLDSFESFLPSDGMRLRSAVLSFAPGGSVEDTNTDRQLRRSMCASLANGMAEQKTHRDPYRTTIILKRIDDQ